MIISRVLSIEVESESVLDTSSVTEALKCSDKKTISAKKNAFTQK